MNQPTTLTADEEITLRRVAFGESLVSALRAPDLAQLYRLRLIEDSKDGPRLTTQGRVRFDALPKAVSLAKSSSADPLTDLFKLLDKQR